MGIAILSVFSLVLSLFFLISLRGKKRKNKKLRYVCVPLYVFIIGFLFNIIISSVILASISAVRLYEAIIYSTCLGVGHFLMIVTMNVGISYTYNGLITSKNFLGAEKRLHYEDIEGIRYEISHVVLYAGKKRINVSQHQQGAHEFLGSIAKWRRNNNKGETKLVRVGTRVFNDNVYNAGSFIAIWAIALLTSLSFLALMLFYPSESKLLHIPISAWIAVVPVLIILALGFIYNYIVSRADKYHRLIKLLIKAEYIKNPNIRKELGLSDIEVEWNINL